LFVRDVEIGYSSQNIIIRRLDVPFVVFDKLWFRWRKRRRGNRNIHTDKTTRTGTGIANLRGGKRVWRDSTRRKRSGGHVLVFVQLVRFFSELLVRRRKTGAV
jgi:hypothetical protein